MKHVIKFSPVFLFLLSFHHQALAQKIEGLVIDSATGEVLEG